MPNEPALPRTQAATSVARGQSSGRPGRELFWIALVTILLGLTRCVPAQRFTAEDLHVSDELEMTLSTLDRLAGVPPTSLNWPGTVQQMLCVPLLGLDYLVTSGLNVSPAGFVEWLGAAYREPQRPMLIMRGLVIAAGTVGLGLWALALCRRTGSVLAGALGAVLLSTNLLAWWHGLRGMADGMCVGLLSAALAFLLPKRLDRRHIVTAGVLAGLALASKMTGVLALPLLIALVLAGSLGHRSRLLWFCLALGAAVVLGCPYFLLDPLRIAKGILGNLSKPGAALGAAAALRMIVTEALGVPLASATLAALLVMVWRRHWGLLAGFLASIGAAVLLTRGAAMVFPRYYIGLVPAAATIVIVALWEFVGSARRWSAAVAAALGAVIVWQTLAAVQVLQRPTDPAPGAVVADLARLPAGTRVIAPSRLDELLMKHADSAALRRLAAACEEGMLGGRSYQSFVAGRSSALARVSGNLTILLSDEEQAFVARKRLAAGIGARPGLDLWLVAPPEVAVRFNLLTAEAAVERLRTGQADVLVLEQPVADEPPAATYADASGRIVYWRYEASGGGP